MPDSLVVRLHDLVVGRLTRGSDPSRVRLDVDAGFDAGAETAVDAPRAIGQQNLHATGLELGETIKNKASEKHCGLAR